MGQVDQPGAGQLRIEHRRLDMRRRTEADDQAVRAGGEGHVHVDADQVPQGALGIRHRPRPVVRLLEQLLPGTADMEPRQIFEEGVPVGGLARRAVHRILAEAAGVALGVPLAVGVRLGGTGRRVQGGHQLQARHGRGAARRHHPRRVHAQHPGEVRRRKLPRLAPVPRVQRVPRRDAQLHTGPLRTLRRAVDPRPRPEPALGELPLRTDQLLDDLVALRNPPCQTLLLREDDRQAVTLKRRLGEHQQRIGILARPRQPRRPELRLTQRPLHQGRQALGGHLQDQAAGAVRQRLPVGVDVDDRQRPVLEPRVALARRGRPPRAGAARHRRRRRRRRPGGARRKRRGRRSSGDGGGAGLGVRGCKSCLQRQAQGLWTESALPPGRVRR